jgi:hypothetical protein
LLALLGVWYVTSTGRPPAKALLSYVVLPQQAAGDILAGPQRADVQVGTIQLENTLEERTKGVEITVKGGTIISPVSKPGASGELIIDALTPKQTITVSYVAPRGGRP